MSDNVVKFPHATPSPPPVGHAPPCATCAYFHPDTWFGTKWGGWFKPRKPTSNAVKYGVCSYFGGGYASVERRARCHGECHSPSSLQPT